MATTARGRAWTTGALGLAAGLGLGIVAPTVVERAQRPVQRVSAGTVLERFTGRAGPDQSVVVSSRTIRRRGDWGRAAWDEVLEAVDGLAPDPADLRTRAIAATLIVSRMDNGPAGDVDDWATYLETGLRNGSCGRRAELASSLLIASSPDASIRLCGMASVPRQGAHTTMEVWLPAQSSWAWFDPSTGTFFTEDGTWDGRILSQREVFADPALVREPGPHVPTMPRVEAPPRSVAFAPPLQALYVVEPGFALSNFPLESMIDVASGWASGDPTVPRPNRVRLHVTELPELRVATVGPEGGIRNEVLRQDGRRLLWADRLGVTGFGLNVMPLVEIDGCAPEPDALAGGGGGRIAHLEVSVDFVLREDSMRVRPMVVGGGRIAAFTLDSGADGRIEGLSRFEHRLVCTVVPTGDRCSILILHDGDEPNELAAITRFAVRPSA